MSLTILYLDFDSRIFRSRAAKAYALAFGMWCVILTLLRLLLE